MAIQGLRTTTNFATDERPLSWREKILLLYPNGQMPFLALTSVMKKRSVTDPQYNWWEKAVQSRRIALAADLTTSNTEVVTAAGAFGYKNGDMFLVENTDEIIYISVDPTTNTGLSVIRGFAGTTETAVDISADGVNPYLMCIGSLFEEGSLAPSGVGFDPTKVYNYTQIFRDALEATRTAMKTTLRTGDSVKEAKREALELHGMGLERAFLFGVRYEGTINGKPARMMNGIIQQIHADNIAVATTDYGSGVTMLGLEQYMLEIFKYGSTEKMALCGNTAALTIQQIIRKNTAWQFRTGEKEFGMDVSRLISPFGTLVLKTVPMFNQIPGGTTGAAVYYGLDSWLLALDMENITYTYMEGSDTTYQPKIETNGMDGMKSGYITECSVEVHHPLTHYLIKNLAVAAADA
jgi:hypothetical protein